ncbi:MAG: hypothetical protein KF696_11565 [Planctomycetes bacterium]|nr:hypothetical protein [Planctomycetota bacterium]MCW8135231.1 hypothetical protein [Planctomycetota bacterium]
MRTFCWLLLLCCLPLCAQSVPDAAAPAADESGKEGDDAGSAPLFRWRVGASLALTHGALLTDPKFNDSMPDEGFVGEFALSGRVTARDYGISAKMRVCWGCHGLDLEEASIQWSPWPWMTARAGRLNVNAGSLNSRHDFSVRRTISKPLTRIMGNMPRAREFNQGVLPAPYSDLGASLAFHWDTGNFGFGIEGFALRGLKGSVTSVDIDFVASRDWRDSNGEPSFGGRMSFDVPFVSLDFAYLWGNYDPGSRRSYHFLSADLVARLGPITLEGEFAFRSTEYQDPAKADREKDFYKYGAWGQLTWQILEPLSLVIAVDTLHVERIFLGANGPTVNPALAVTDDHNRIVRIQGGVGWTPWGGIMVRVMAEYWEFSDFHDSWVIQAGLGWAF